MLPLFIDWNAFFGEPERVEQGSGVIVDARKVRNLQHRINQDSGPPAESVTDDNAKIKVEGGAVAFKDGGALAFKDGGALAFNEAQLMKELGGVQKGGAIGPIAASLITTLISEAPNIINSIKSLRKGGAVKFGGASAAFLEGIDPDDYDDFEELFRTIKKQNKNVIKSGGALIAGSGKVGTFFKNAWRSLKSFYDNNKDKLKPITDILADSAKETATKYIDKGVDYIGNKTGSDTVRRIGNVVGDVLKDTANTGIDRIANNDSESKEPSGSGMSFEDREVKPKEKKLKKSKKVMVSIDPREPVTVISQARKRVY